MFSYMFPSPATMLPVRTGKEREVNPYAFDGTPSG